MLSPHPIISIRLAVPRADGDVDQDVIATATGIREADRGEFFYSLIANLRAIDCPTDGLSLTVADSILCEPARVYEMAVKVAEAVAVQLAADRRVA